MELKKHKIMILLICFAIIILGLILCIKNKEQSPDEFEFSLVFSANGDDMISTFDNSFRVNTVEGFKVVQLELTEEEKDKIKRFIIDRRITKEKGFVGNSKGFHVDPCEKCTFTYVLNGKENTISWTSESFGPYSYSVTERKVVPLKGNEENYKKVMNLFELRELIEEIIYQHEETNGLPGHALYD